MGAQQPWGGQAGDGLGEYIVLGLALRRPAVSTEEGCGQEMEVWKEMSLLGRVKMTIFLLGSAVLVPRNFWLRLALSEYSGDSVGQIVKFVPGRI